MNHTDVHYGTPNSRLLAISPVKVLQHYVSIFSYPSLKPIADVHISDSLDVG